MSYVDAMQYREIGTVAAALIAKFAKTQEKELIDLFREN
jgi:hypothetical protein